MSHASHYVMTTISQVTKTATEPSAANIEERFRDVIRVFDLHAGEAGAAMAVFGLRAWKDSDIVALATEANYQKLIAALKAPGDQALPSYLMADSANAFAEANLPSAWRSLLKVPLESHARNARRPIVDALVASKPTVLRALGISARRISDAALRAARTVKSAPAHGPTSSAKNQTDAKAAQVAKSRAAGLSEPLARVAYAFRAHSTMHSPAADSK